MLFNWFSAGEATEIGVSLADDFVLQAGSSARTKSKGAATQGRDLAQFLQKFLQRVDRDARPLKLNLFKRAKLANSFKWRLLEKGVEREIADELTSALVTRLSAETGHQASATTSGGSSRRNSASAQMLLANGNACMGHGAYEEAIACYEELLA